MITQQTYMSEEPLPCYRKRPPDWLVTSEGYPFIFLGGFVSLFIWKAFGFWMALPTLALTGYCVSFFRNPRRTHAKGEDWIIAPADGKVLEVVPCEETRYLKGPAQRVSIFMSPLNCHINRAPIAGKVLDCFYKTGTFKAAYSPKSMQTNEHHAVLMEDEKGRKWLVVQIAGWLARRIVSYVQPGFALKQGERFGLIQFGSRSDLYCPVDVEILVKPGQKVYAGKTILGRIH